MKQMYLLKVCLVFVTLPNFCSVNQPYEYVDVCTSLKIEQYPTLMFIGYPDMNQGVNGNLYGLESNERNGRIVLYEADLYPDVLYDWMVWMNNLSMMYYSVSRIVDYFSISAFLPSFGSSTNHNSVSVAETNALSNSALEINKYKETISQNNDVIKLLEDQIVEYEDELNQYKNLEMFSSLQNHGNPFELMNQYSESIDAATTVDSTADGDTVAINPVLKSIVSAYVIILFDIIWYLMVGWYIVCFRNLCLLGCVLLI